MNDILFCKKHETNREEENCILCKNLNKISDKHFSTIRKKEDSLLKKERVYKKRFFWSNKVYGLIIDIQK